MFRFESPYFLILLLLIPAAAYYRKTRGRIPAMSVPSLLAVRKVPVSWIMRLKPAVSSLKYIAFALMVFALARPQWGTERMNVTTEGINIILSVDLSGSMAALDFRRKGKIVNRLEAVKGVVQDFVAGRNGDRIGLVVFGSEAYTQLPLTRDYNTIVSILDRLEIGAAGQSTAIGDAVGISLKRIEDIESKSNIIILLTDGRSNSGELSPAAAAEIAREKKVKIYTVGVGSRDKEVPIPVNHPVFGERYVYEKIEIDEATLKKIARDTGGMYFRAEDLKGLERIYETIDELEKTEVKVESFAEYNEYYLYFLLPAFGVLGLWIVLTNTRFLEAP